MTSISLFYSLFNEYNSTDSEKNTIPRPELNCTHKWKEMKKKNTKKVIHWLSIAESFECFFFSTEFDYLFIST